MTINPAIPATDPIRRRGSVDVLGTISSLLAGYSGGITIVRELAQNTDDVPGEGERWLEFHFYPDKMVIRNNTVFRDVDFDNIMRIARGGKQQEQRRTIGAFGVGFVSVYQLTDTPIVRSADRELHMMPGLDDFPIDEYPRDRIDETIFTLPYRRKATPVGTRLRMPQVTDAWVNEIMATLPQETYRLLFFLRRLSRIAVFQNGLLISEVSRAVANDDDGFERITLTYRHGESPATTHTWLRFSGQVPGNAPLRSDGQPAKDRTVHIVVPDSDIPDTFLHEHMAGRLYNYLPTEIATGLPFQINGDFFPSTDRKSVDNDHPNSKEWNSRVLHAIGSCAAAALPKLLTRFANAPIQLYRRIDVGKASELVAPVSAALLNAARFLEIFKTSDGWRDRINTRWIKPELRDIAQMMSPALMAADLQEAAAHLLARLDVREFTFTDALACIRRDVQRGTQLANAPAYLRTITQVEALYNVLDSGLAQGIDTMVQQTPIFLDHTGRLWPADNCVKSSQEDLRKELAESGLHFWNFNPERYRLAASMVQSFRLDDLWDALRRQLPNEITLADAPEWLNSPTKLYRLYRTIIRTREPVVKSAVAGLPICINREMRLCRPERLLLPERDPVLYEILADDADTPLVAKQMYDDRHFRDLYNDFGVPAFALTHLFERLSKLAREEVELEKAHPCLNSREKLLRVYRYLRDNRGELESKHVEALRHRLPIWLCRDGFLRLAKERALPPDATNLPTFIRVDHVLDLDGNELLRTFLADTVQLRPLGVDQFIRHALIPQFAALERKNQIDALRFIRDSIATVRDNITLCAMLKQTPLIYGDDDRLHRPIDLCFPRASCRMLFLDRFNEPNAYYAPPTSGDFAGWPWYDLFRLLGVNHLAPADVILEEVRRIIRRTPHQGREQVEKIFRYLEEHWEDYQAGSLGRALRDERWLPADGDTTHWYRPKELYQRQDKPLVSHVAPVLGFSEARRPKANISDTLGFPSSVPIELMVRQLLTLSAQGEPASSYLYQTLSRSTISYEELKPLRGLPVIYANDRYWKPEQIFLSKQTSQFGRYRGYLESSELRLLFQRLGCREEPIPQDYIDLLREISTSFRENVPPNEVKLITNAYERLARSAPTSTLQSLQSIPCVLTDWQVGEHKTFALRLPESVVLTPPDEYQRLIPGLPVAVYTPSGEATLQVLGVRKIEQVLVIKHLLQPSFSHPFELARYFGPLARAIRRLFFHYNRSLEHDLPALEQQLGRLRGYLQEGIQVTYRVRLGLQEYSSQPTKRHIFYQAEQGHVYLDKRLSEAERSRELARVLGEVLNLRNGNHSMLKELIADPRGASRILDDNNIKPLPQELELSDIEEITEDFQVGMPHSEEIISDPPAPRTSDKPDSGVSVQQILPDDFFTEQAASNKPNDGQHSARTNGSAIKTNGKQQIPERNGTMAGGGNDSSGIKTPRNGNNEYILPGGSHTPIASTKSETGKSSVVQPRAPKPQPDPNAPAFSGTTTDSSPAIATDYDSLRGQIRSWADATGQSLTSEAIAPTDSPRRSRSARAEQAEQRNVARFVLNFGEVRDGYLRLTTAHARFLFQGSPTRVECRTDMGKGFPLWLDWHRDVPIAYNQEALSDFFTTEAIPAGGIVYLQREHDETFRLFYKRMPHVVPEVRIAFNDQGTVRYETYDTEVICETDDAIYRAERRFEDQAALWLQAAGKKSVEEILCELLMTAPDGWRHEDELKAMLGAVRMVAASTVAQTLRAKSYFQHDKDGNWRLNPAQFFAHIRNDAVTQWQRAMSKLLGSDDQILGEALPALRPPLNELTGRLIRIEAALAPSSTIDENELTLIQQLNDEPDNHILGASVARALQQRASAADVDLALDTQFRVALSAASDEVWATNLRATLHELYTRFRQAGKYQRALALARSWNDYDRHHGLDLAELELEVQAADLLTGSPPILHSVLQAIDLAPNLALAREKLHLAVQAELRKYEPTVFLAQGADENAVDSFFAHVATVIGARRELKRDKVPAFDRTVLEEARRLFPYISATAQVRLIFWLRRYINIDLIMLSQSELESLIKAADSHSGKRTGLLIATATWNLCPDGHVLQKRIADQLATCHNSMEIWEKANNRPWKQHASELLRQELQRGWEKHSATLIARERRLLELLCTPDHSPLGITLELERAELYKRYEHEYQLLLESAA